MPYDPSKPAAPLPSLYYNVFLCDDDTDRHCFGVVPVCGMDTAIKELKTQKAAGYWGAYIKLASNQEEAKQQVEAREEERRNRDALGL